MARDRRPLTDDEIEELREEMRSQRDDLREYLENEDVDTSGRATSTDDGMERDAADSD